MLKILVFFFANCCELNEIPDISLWNTENIIDLSYMFYKCEKIKNLPELSNKWNLKNCWYMRGMFDECPLLENKPNFPQLNNEDENDNDNYLNMKEFDFNQFDKNLNIDENSFNDSFDDNSYGQIKNVYK